METCRVSSDQTAGPTQSHVSKDTGAPKSHLNVSNVLVHLHKVNCSGRPCGHAHTRQHSKRSYHLCNWVFHDKWQYEKRDTMITLACLTLRELKTEDRSTNNFRWLPVFVELEKSSLISKKKGRHRAMHCKSATPRTSCKVGNDEATRKRKARIIPIQAFSFSGRSRDATNTTADPGMYVPRAGNRFGAVGR